MDSKRKDRRGHGSGARKTAPHAKIRRKSAPAKRRRTTRQPTGDEPRLAIIGFGAITSELLRCLEVLGKTDWIVGILDVPARVEELRATVAGRFALVDRLESLLALKPSLVIEAAGHSAIRAFAAPILAQGFDLMIASVGALADPALARNLRDASRSGARLLVPAGAVAGIDGLLAARTAGLRAVTYSSLKPPIAWQGTPAEKLLDLPNQKERAVFFEGSAREAAIHYPQNANVGATVALAGLGLDRTRVKLIADPEVPCPLGIIDAEGDFGTFRFEILAHAAPTNPKTSLLTAHSLISAVRLGHSFSAFDQLD